MSRKQVIITALDIGWQVNVADLVDEGAVTGTASVVRHACTSAYEVLRLVAESCGLEADTLTVTVMPGCAICGESFGKLHNIGKHTKSLDWSPQ